MAAQDRGPGWAFKPSIIGLEFDFLHSMAYDFIMKNEVRLQQHLYGHVVLVGELRGLRDQGETLRDALRDALIELASPGTPVHVTIQT